MDTLTQLQQNRQVIQDLTSSTLAALPGAFARLAYLASLRNFSSNVYEHAGLAALYRPEAVQQALEQCHEEIFERILETPLSVQEEDLRAHLSSTRDGLHVAVSHWRKLEAYRALLPAEASVANHTNGRVGCLSATRAMIVRVRKVIACQMI